jgi:hypothetical protein
VDTAREADVEEARREARDRHCRGAVDADLGGHPAPDRSGQRPGAVGRGVDLGAELEAAVAEAQDEARRRDAARLAGGDAGEALLQLLEDSTLGVSCRR